MVIVWVKDLFFGSKIETEAGAHSASVCFVHTPKEMNEAVVKHSGETVLVDLDASNKTVEAIRTLKEKTAGTGIRVIGFLSHVHADLAEKAKAAGCDLVMPRSLLAAKLPEIFESVHSPVSL